MNQYNCDKKYIYNTSLARRGKYMYIQYNQIRKEQNRRELLNGRKKIFNKNLRKGENFKTILQKKKLNLESFLFNQIYTILNFSSNSYYIFIRNKFNSNLFDKIKLLSTTNAVAVVQEVVVCWLISRKTTVQTAGQTSKRNLKYFFGDFLKLNSDKNYVSK